MPELRFNGEVDLSMVIAGLALMLTLLQFAVTAIRNYASSRRGQASSISAWIEKPEEIEKRPVSALAPTAGNLEAVLNNGSSEPVYDVVVTVVNLYGSGLSEGRRANPNTGHLLYPTLPPGSLRQALGHIEFSMGKVAALEISFADKNGICWVRSGNGKLRRLWFAKTPLKYYGIGLPPNWTRRY